MNNRIVLIGDENSKRYEYFKKACDEFDIDFTFMNYNNIKLKQGDVVKIDPISIDSYNISDMNSIINNYQNILKNLNNYNNIKFLNSPDNIMLCMDKYRCKKNIDMDLCTYMYDKFFKNADELFLYLTENKINAIFIKPRYGSGATGIIALKWNYVQQKAIAYTTVYNHKNHFYNTKNINRIYDIDIIKNIINFVLNMGSIIEKWIPKKRYKNLYYDIRAVIVNKKLISLIPRASNSPITNLHINNMALDDSIISNFDDIEIFCNKIMDYFPNMIYAGIDILITENNKLFLIEINAQGDAIYKDFYDNNSIYKEQINIMRRLANE